jgi:membrane-associated phospholipid phosphatase
MVRFLTGLLSVMIVLSTMFLKQHSVVDVSLGILMSAAVQMFCDRVFAGEEQERKLRRAGLRRIS